MKKASKSVWLVLVFQLSMSCSLFQTGDQELILYQLPSELLGNDIETELVVINPEGDELRRLTIPGYVQLEYPTGRSGQAVYHTGEAVYLVDAKLGTVQELSFPQSVNDQLRPCFGCEPGDQQNWLALCNILGDISLLVNLETGHVSNFKDIDDELRNVFSVQFSPGEKYLAIYGSSWLFFTEDLNASRNLNIGENIQVIKYGGFSSDGSSIAYVQRVTSTFGGDEIWQLVVEDIESLAQEVFNFNDRLSMARFTPDDDHLIVASGDELTIHSLGDGGSETLLSFSGSPVGSHFSPNGERMLFGFDEDYSVDGDTFWFWIDLDREGIEDLRSLDGYWDVRARAGVRWLFFIDDYNHGTGRHFVSLDMESGDVLQFSPFDEDVEFIGTDDVSSDGRLLFVKTRNASGDIQLWLLDADTGDKRILAEGRSVSGSFSSDGTRIALGTLFWPGSQSITELTLVDDKGEFVRDLGEGINPIWIRP